MVFKACAPFTCLEVYSILHCLLSCYNVQQHFSCTIHLIIEIQGICLAPTLHSIFAHCIHASIGSSSCAWYWFADVKSKQ